MSAEEQAAVLAAMPAEERAEALHGMSREEVASGLSADPAGDRAVTQQKKAVKMDGAVLR